MWDHMDGMAAGGWGIGVITLVLFWVLIALAIALLWKQLAAGRDTSLRVLDERYARGELSREEYVQKRSDMKR